MTRFLSEHPDWQAAAWPVYLRQLTDAQRFEEAVHGAAEHYHVSLTLPGSTPATSPETSPDPLRRTDETRSKFESYWREGNTIAARQVLEEATGGDGKPPVDPEYWRIRAALAAQDLAWAAAWQHLKRHLQLVYPAEALP